jgi:hypothetical protein
MVSPNFIVQMVKFLRLSFRDPNHCNFRFDSVKKMFFGSASFKNTSKLIYTCKYTYAIHPSLLAKK